MDWSNYDNELFKKYSENLFDDYIDNRIECGNLIEDNNNYMDDYEIKPDEFILDKCINKNQISNQKADLNFDNFYENNFSNENMDFSDSKLSEEASKTKINSEKNALKVDNVTNKTANSKVSKSDNLSNNLTEYSSSPFINYQISTNNYSNTDDSKSRSSDSVSNSNKKSITNEKNNKNSEENDNEKNNFINYDENLSMQNNNFSEYHDEEMNVENYNNNIKGSFNPIKNNLLVGNKEIQDKIALTANINNMINAKQHNILFSNQAKISVSLSERMKAKIQKTKDLLEKKHYKASENANMNEYCIKNGKKFHYNLESAHEFSELKNNNICKKSDCSDCISIMNRINYLNNSFQNSQNINGISNQIQKRINNNNQANTAKNSIYKEKQNLTEIHKLEKSSERKQIENKCNNKADDLNQEENSAALVNKNESINNLNNESFSSNGTSMNSCIDISLNENSFSGICNRNNLSKKELKMLRNRISAQKSRDRKKKEMDDLKLITQELFNQNIKLKKQLEEKDNKISEFKEMFNSLCEKCKGKINVLKTKNKNCANYLLEENKLFINSLNSNNKYLDVGESIELTKKIDSAELNKNINDLKNNLITNKRNRVIDFPTIINAGNRRIYSNAKCGIMTGFLVIACILGTFAFNYGFSFVNQNEDYLIKQSGFTGRILQEIPNEEIQKIANYSGKSDYLPSNETYFTNTFKAKNRSSIISLDSFTQYASKSLAVYTKKNHKYSKKISLKELNEISQKRNSDYYNTTRNKINIDYYLQLTKQIVDKVDKNIYDLTYLTNLSEESKNAITQNMIEHIDKINKFFEIKLTQFADNNYKEMGSGDFSFLGKKRLNFIERNNFDNKNNKKNKENNNSAFLKYNPENINQEDEKCFEPKGVLYTISDLLIGSGKDLDYEDSSESAFEELKIDDYFSNDEAKGIKKASKRYFRYNTENSNIRNVKYESLNKAYDSKSLMVKKNYVINKRDLVSLPFILNNGENDNVNSLYCKDFMSLADENSEFFRRIFAKLDLQKKADILREQLDLKESVFDDVNKNKEEKIIFNQKNDDDCLYLHMILPEKNYKIKDSSSAPQDYKISNSSSFNKNSNNNNNNKQVFYEVGCKIFEINKFYK